MPPPVDWYPWSQEAFDKARQEDKPIFLSIGYLTCHWCNVMEEESFSDPELATVLNDTFIAIKVDREERPDIDQNFMDVCQLLTDSCGWPLTIFLTPEARPFYASTYIPRDNRFGRTGLLELISRVRSLWQEERDQLLASAGKIRESLAARAVLLPGGNPGDAVLLKGYNQLAGQYDRELGGFGRGQKFPNAAHLFFLLRYWKRNNSTEALAMVENTLRNLRDGGIYDQVGYGFHRYTTDRRWRQPHFEKMLYDQALMTLVYLEAFQATGRPEYRQTAEELIGYVLAEMQDRQGAFYSAESADSNGEEGLFYLWTVAEIEKLLGRELAGRAVELFHLEKEGNFADPISGAKTGRNVLYSDPGGRNDPDFEKIRRQLAEARRLRLRPEKDDKILADWNGLMIAALAKAGQVLDEPRYGREAARAAGFILKTMTGNDGGLMHRWRQGNAGITGQASDYAFFIWGLIELYEYDFDAGWLDSAISLNRYFSDNFWDPALGGYFMTAADSSGRLLRLKDSADRAIPAANSVAMQNLLRLNRMTGDPALEKQADLISSAFSRKLEQFPAVYTMLLSALDFAMGPTHEIVLVGDADAADTKRLIKVFRQTYQPRAVLLFRPAAAADPPILRHAGFLEFMTSVNGQATAYVCTDFNCNFPTTDPARMLELLQPSVAEKK